MRVDCSELYAQEFFEAALTVSLVTGEQLEVVQPTADMVALLDAANTLFHGELTGSGVGSELCIFVPKHLKKSYELSLSTVCAVRFLRILFPSLLFCGHQVSITLTNTLFETVTPYYIKDNLLAYFHRYYEKADLFFKPDGEIKFVVKGKYVLDQAPSFLFKQQERLIAIRGEIIHEDLQVRSLLELYLKQLDVPVHILSRSGLQPMVHLNALYGTGEGYDNDFADIVFYDALGSVRPQDIRSVFEQDITSHNQHTLLLFDIIIVLSLIGGQMYGQEREELVALSAYLHSCKKKKINYVDGMYLT